MFPLLIGWLIPRRILPDFLAQTTTAMNVIQARGITTARIIKYTLPMGILTICTEIIPLSLLKVVLLGSVSTVVLVVELVLVVVIMSMEVVVVLVLVVESLSRIKMLVLVICIVMNHRSTDHNCLLLGKSRLRKWPVMCYLMFS
jgi:hypothetical protein